MGIGVGGVAVGRSLEIVGEGPGSSPRFLRRELVGPKSDATDNFPELECVRLRLNRLSTIIPLLLGVLAFLALITTSSMIVLFIIVVLPTAFRIWIVVHSLANSATHLYDRVSLPRPTRNSPPTA